MTEHPWVMIVVIFLGCISAGIIIGYMYHTYDETFPKPAPVPAIQSHYGEVPYYHIDGNELYLNDSSNYNMLYRGVIHINYSTIPDDAVITNATMGVY